MVNVVIPTANRPLMLRQALKSVSAQTACDCISTVLVSENGNNTESRQVCAEFSELPIQYVFRKPAISALEHGRILMSEGIGDEYTAILHDDDWWMPEHLANGLQALSSRPNGVASFASFYEVSDEAGLVGSSSGHFYWWFGAGYPKLDKVWELTLPEIAMASFLGAAGHYSSLIARSGVLQKAFKVVSTTNNPLDNDRMLLVALATYGAVLYQPVANLFVRWHSMQDVRTFKPEAVALHQTQTTNWILDTCAGKGIDWQSLIASQIIKCPAQARFRLNGLLHQPFCVPLGRHLAVRFPEIASLVPSSWTPTWSRKTKDALRQVLPPIIIRFFR